MCLSLFEKSQAERMDILPHPHINYKPILVVELSDQYLCFILGYSAIFGCIGVSHLVGAKASDVGLEHPKIPVYHEPPFEVAGHKQDIQNEVSKYLAIVPHITLYFHSSFAYGALTVLGETAETAVPGVLVIHFHRIFGSKQTILLGQTLSSV